MRSGILWKYVCALLYLSTGVAAIGQEPDDPNAAPFENRISGYIAAFNSADAVAVAGFWTEQGEFITAAGEKLQGRSEISAKFKEWFAESGNGQLELVDPQVEIQSPGVAIETGIARVTVAGEEPSETGYRAVLVKSADGWKIDSISEQELEPETPSNFERLQELEWMVGQWSCESDASRVEANCRWTTNHNFLIQTYRVTPLESDVLEVTQIIGWDPEAESIRSWTFDSDGGFGAGRWSGGDGRWSCQSLSVLPDGRRGSATSIYEKIDENNLRYSSIGRQVDGELIPNVDPVVIGRVFGSSGNQQ